MTFRSSLLLAFRFMFPASSSKNAAPAPAQARNSVFAAVCCVALSLVPLVVVLVVSDGLIGGMTSRIIELSSFHIQAIQYHAEAESEANIARLRELSQKIRAIKGVESTCVERSGVALAAGKSARSGATIRAVESGFFAGDESFRSLFKLHSGSMELARADSAVIGKALSEAIGLECGDTLRLITMRTLPNGKMAPKIASFTVCGIVSCGYQELDALWVFIPLETGFDFLASNVSRVLIGVKTADAHSAELYALQSRIQRALGTDFGVYTWEDFDEARYANFRSSKLLLLLVMCLIVLVASVNISSALVMLVMERRKEITILKSLGATPAGIKRAFVLTGFFTGLGGVLLGLPLGILCSLNVNAIIRFIEKTVNAAAYCVYTVRSAFAPPELFVPVKLLDPAYYLAEIPVSIPFAEVFGIAALTLLLSVLVSLGPARKAGKEKPLDTLRKI